MNRLHGCKVNTSGDRRNVLVFDLYGTLVDWRHNIASFIEYYATKEAVEEFFACDIKEVHSYKPYKEVLRKCLADVLIKHGALINDELVESFILMFSKSPPYPDTIYGLKILRKHGCETAILSNTDKDLINITLNGFKELFDYVITAEEVKSYKPLLTAFLKAYEIMGIKPSEAIHISAYPQYDLEPASKLGALTILVDRGLGYSWPMRVKNLLELKNFLFELNIIG
ncbi:MAG: HAD hydrolase-like protein [Desulfurococcaceae archaeon]